MDLHEEKRASFEAAREKLARRADDLLGYAALDLRRCLEAMVYQKLWARKNWIPLDIARTWQPPQAFAALLSIEPEAGRDMTLAVGPASSTPNEIPASDSFRSLGVERRPQLRWLKKTYNKLGNFLHVPSPFTQAPSNQTIRDFLETTIRELEPYVHNDLTFAIANVIH